MGEDGQRSVQSNAGETARRGGRTNRPTGGGGPPAVEVPAWKVYFATFGAHSASSPHSPALTAVTVLALALGLGLTTMMFSIVYGAFWRGLPFEESERLIHLEQSNLSADIQSLAR